MRHCEVVGSKGCLSQRNKRMKVKWRCELIVYHDHNAKEQSKGTSLQTHDIIPVYVHVLVPPPPFFLYASGIGNIIPKNHLRNGIFFPNSILLLLPLMLVILKIKVITRYNTQYVHPSQRCCTNSKPGRP